MRASHKAQVGGGRGSAGDFGSFSPAFVGGRFTRVDEGVVVCGTGGGCDNVSIGWYSCNTICGVGVGLDGSR